MFYRFKVGTLYRRRDVYRVIGIPEDTKGGNWDTGYSPYGDAWFIFCNIGIPGRTGHDYPNEWVGPYLLWYGKTSAALRHKSIQSMLDGSRQVYIFVRADQNAPFVFVGCGQPQAVKDTVPVTVLWSLAEPIQTPVVAQPFAHLVRESLEETVYKVTARQNETDESNNLQDARKRVLRYISQRRGQPGFRYTLLSAYEGKCSFTETTVADALEAAHIIPYRETQTNSPANGLLLRADIHTLFDLGRLAVKTENMSVVLSPQLRGSSYAQLDGRRLSLPREKQLRPDVDALDQHRSWAGL